MKKLLCGLLCVLAIGVTAHAATENIVLTKDNTLTINDVFYDDSVAPIIKQAKELDARIPSGDPLYLVINSPGGSIEAGIELINDLGSLRRPVNTISLFSASMGFQTVQGLGQRLITKSGTLMSHKASGGMYGEMPGQFDTRYQYWLKRISKLDETVVERSKGKYTLQSYHDLIRDEYWCDGDDCVKAAMADKVVTVTCDKSLEGTKTVSIVQTIMSGHTVEITADYDLCPTNTNALVYHILVDGSPLFPNGSNNLAKQAASQSNAYNAYDPLGLFSSTTSSSVDSARPNLTKEELFTIKQFVDDTIKKHESKEVIRGY